MSSERVGESWTVEEWSAWLAELDEIERTAVEHLLDVGLKIEPVESELMGARAWAACRACGARRPAVTLAGLGVNAGAARSSGGGLCARCFEAAEHG